MTVNDEGHFALGLFDYLSSGNRMNNWKLFKQIICKKYNQNSRAQRYG